MPRKIFMQPPAFGKPPDALGSMGRTA